jgi:hypothetical protein
MRHLLLAAAALAALGAAPALADPPGGCPPGLAKKGTGCLPPGQAKKIYGIGDRIDDGYIIRNPGRHGLDPDQTYYRVGDYVYRVDRETRAVLDLVGAVSRVLN